MRLPDQLIESIYSDIHVDRFVVDDLYTQCKGDHLKFVNLLVKENYIDRKKYGELIGKAIGYAYLPLDGTLIDLHSMALMPQELSEKYKCLPVYKFGDAVTIAHQDPTNINERDVLEKIIGTQVSFVFSYIDEIENSISIHYKSLTDPFVINQQYSHHHNEEITTEKLEILSKSKNIISLCEKIILEGLKCQSSDIHIEPKKYHVLIRYRINGILNTRFVLSTGALAGIVSRFKVLAQLDISNNKSPQDGRFTMTLPQRDIDIRVSVIASLHGEKIALRILGNDQRANSYDFEKLGFFDTIKYRLLEALARPSGLILVTGPTGSGKTTTLHSALHYINNPNINIIAVEDPVEYEHPGVTQISVNEKQNRGFSAILRSILRQDPDIIMIGEIRDPETAKIAANAALTGHLVLSSIHTNSAAQAVTRLVDMGVEHFVIAPSIVGILGQRLVRCVCRYCKTAYKPSKVLVDRYVDFDYPEEDLRFYYGKGCKYCDETGYLGRMPIHEYLEIDSHLRSLILDANSGDDFYRQILRSKSYIKYNHDAMIKVLLGMTTIDEVIRVTTGME